MAKWDVVISEDQARRVAEKLFPDDVYDPASACEEDCDHCNDRHMEWEAVVRQVWSALQVLE